MQEQSAAPVNSDYFTKLTAQVNACDGCAELQKLVNEALASIQAQFDGVGSQISALAPIKELLEIPHDLASLITWAKKVITDIITPIYKPYITYVTQLEQMIQELTALTTAIQNAASKITNCSISLPTMNIPNLPTP